MPTTETVSRGINKLQLWGYDSGDGRGERIILGSCRGFTRLLARIFHTPCDEIGGSAVEIVIEPALIP
jgi:hypothetical protein